MSPYMYEVLALLLLPSLFQMLSSLSHLDFKCPSHTPRRPTHFGRSVLCPRAKPGKHLSALRVRLGSPDHVCPVHCCTRRGPGRAGPSWSGECVKEQAVHLTASERHGDGAASLGRQARARPASPTWAEGGRGSSLRSPAQAVPPSSPPN